MEQHSSLSARESGEESIFLQRKYLDLINNNITHTVQCLELMKQYTGFIAPEMKSTIDKLDAMLDISIHNNNKMVELMAELFKKPEDYVRN